MVLGARVVASCGDPALARAAGDALARVEAVLPDRLRDRLTAHAAVRARLPCRRARSRRSSLSCGARCDDAAQGASRRIRASRRRDDRPDRAAAGAVLLGHDVVADRLVRAARATSAASAWTGCERCRSRRCASATSRGGPSTTSSRAWRRAATGRARGFAAPRVRLLVVPQTAHRKAHVGAERLRLSAPLGADPCRSRLRILR